MGRFHYLKAGQWGMFTDEGNLRISEIWGRFLRRPSRTTALEFLRAYARIALKNKEAADPAVREVVHFRMQVMCEEHGLPMDEMWNAIIKRKCRGEEDENEQCNGK